MTSVKKGSSSDLNSAIPPSIDPSKKRRIKRLKFPIGSGALTVFRLPDGLGIKADKEGKKISKHVTMLVNSQGQLGAHETDERYPHKHPKRNRSLWKVDFSQVENQMAAAAVELQSLISQKMQSMLNPDLCGTKLLTFPFLGDDAMSMVEAPGRTGVIQPGRLDQIRLINPDELEGSTCRAFFVLRKARVYWHADGLLIKAPSNGARLLMDYALMGEIVKIMFRGGGLSPEMAKDIPPRIKFRNSTVYAWQRGSRSQRGKALSAVEEERKKVALVSLSSNIGLFQTGILERFIGVDPKPQEAHVQSDKKSS